MGGGGSVGPGLSSEDFAKLREAANAKLRELAAKSTLILFVAEAGDRRSLDSHLARSSNIFPANRIQVVDGSDPKTAFSSVAAATFVVLFTNDATDTTFLSKLADIALAEKKAAIHVQAKPTSAIPSKVTANRWRSVDWAELEKLFS